MNSIRAPMSVFATVTAALSSLKLSAFGQNTQNVVSLLQKQEQVRIRQIADFREWYNGHHFPIEREDGALPYANLSYAQVEKSIIWLTGKAPAITFRPDIHTIMDELIQEVIDNSGGDSIYYKILQMGAVTGDCFIHVYWDPSVNQNKGGVCWKVLDSARTFVEYNNVGQIKKLTKVMIQWEELDEAGEIRTITEIWDKDTVRTYPANSTTSSILTFPSVDRSAINTNSAHMEAANPYGELPFIHITNLVLQDTVYGRSDLHDIKTLNKELNNALVSYKDNVDYTGNPITLLFGLAATQIKRAPGRLWGGLPKDAKVEHLTMDSTHQQIENYTKMLEKYIGLGGIPTPLLNLEQSQSYADTTNTGLRLYFLPIIELSARKQMSYHPGMKAAIEMSLRFVNDRNKLGLEQLNAPDPALVEKLTTMPMFQPQVDPQSGQPLPMDPKLQQMFIKLLGVRTKPFYECEFEFVELMAKNRMYELMDIDIELRNKLESVRGAMKRLGITDPEAKMKEIVEDQKFVASLDQMYAAMSAPPTPETAPYTQMSVDNASAQIPGAAQPNQGGDTVNSPQQTEAQTGQPADATIAKQGGM